MLLPLTKFYKGGPAMQYSTKIGKFLETVCEQIRWKKTHSMISEEIENHIIDQKNAFMDEGLDEETATDKAIKEMGDPVFIGAELDRTHRPKTEWSIIFLTGIILLFGFGIRLLTSFEPDIPFMLERSLISTLIGMGCMSIAYFLDFTIIGRYPKSIFMGLTALTIGVMIASPVVYGRPAYVQFVLLLFPTVMSGIVYNMRNKGYLGIILSGIFLIIPALIGIMASSLSMVFLCVVAFLILITIAIVSGWFNVSKPQGLLLVYIPTIVISGAILIKLVFNRQYLLDRLLNLINQYRDPMGSGYIIVKIRDMLYNAKFIGRGTLSIDSYMIPSINTDYILTYLIHRLGWISFIVVMSVISLFIIHGFKLCSKQKSILGRLVSTAVLITFTTQVIFYTISNLGYPIIGSLTLPFISYSGMSTIINMTLIGIMLSVFKSGDIVRDNLVTSKEVKGKFIEIVDGKIIIDLNTR